ncbi:tyrosine-type recombinase/integrase [Brevibacillus brevis]|nr:tyrosine-type recombinase/integrase [Brevibacillus brevis]
MNTFLIEMEKFISNTMVLNSTKVRYRKNLIDFAMFLKESTNTELQDLHLEKMYEIIDRSGNLLAFKPINEALIDQYFFSNRTRGYQWLTTNRSTLGSFFMYLEKNYDFPNIMKTIEFKTKNYKPLRRPPKILSRHDVLRLLQSIVRNSKNLLRDLLLFLLLISTGCRISEILTLQFKNVDFELDVLHIWMSKTKRNRTIVLREGIGKCIEQFRFYSNLQPIDFIFRDNNNEPMRVSEVRSLLHSFCKQAGLPAVRIHALRHTFATLMYEQGSELQVIQQFLGHVSVRSTQIYVHPNYERNSGFVNKENEQLYQKLKQSLLQ